MVIEADRSLSILVHGVSKAGKSTLSTTTPAPRVLCDVESASRFLDIRRVYWDPKDPPPEYDGTWDTCVVRTRDWSTVEAVHSWLASGKHPFRSLVIDSISELQNRFIESVAGRKQLTQAQWGDAYRVVGGLVRDIRDLTMHPTKPLECVMITAMTKQVDGKYSPWCQGQLQTVIPYLMDAVGYLYVATETDELTGEAQTVRKLLTRGTSTFEAGERVGGAWPQVIDEPRIDSMIDMIFGPVPGSDAVPPAKSATEGKTETKKEAR